MLCQFSFENYKSFKNQTTLDFFAEDISDNIESLIIDKYTSEKFLPVAVIYGPNGGGKSNLLEAVYYLYLMVLSPIQAFRGINNAILIDRKLLIEKSVCHKFSEKCKEMPVKFDVLFKQDEYTFNYQLSVLDNKITEEKLFYADAKNNIEDVVFERKKDKITTKGETVKNTATQNINDYMPFLSHLAINYKIPVIKKAEEGLLKSDFINCSNPIQDINIDVAEYDPILQKKLFDVVQAMGINIQGARIEKILNHKKVYMKHKMPNGSLVEIPANDESAGTIKIFSFLTRVIKGLETGKLLVIDELDAKLHPKLLKYIIQLYTNPEINKKGAQLLFTSHCISTLTNEVFRRDEVWFCAMNPENASSLYSLISLRDESGNLIRKDAAFGKQYLEGRYGADPYLRKMLNWGENDK